MQCISICRYDERYTPSEWRFSNITRPFSLVYFILGGVAYYTADGVERRFQKNHLYIFPANKVISLREDPSDKLYLFFLHAFISPELESVVELDVCADAFLSKTLSLMRHYAKCEEDIYMRKLTDMLLSYITETHCTMDSPLCERIKAYVDQNYASVFKGGDLSRHFNYSLSHLTKVFREKYEITPKQYARRLMLKEIERLLYTGLAVAEISDRLDFSSPENLSRFFKSAYGYSPTEHKKRLAK